MFRPSYWVFPIISGVVWLGMLLGLLIYWCVDAKFTHYSSMSPSQTIAYISDVGASKLKPLFITGCCVTTVFLDLSFVLDLWLRHRGRLVPNTETKEKVFSWLTIGFAILGTCGLILLSIFDTVRHPRLHDVFLLLFIAGYVLSAIFLCCQYQRLGKRHREHRVLRISFYLKLVFVIVEILLAIAFIACNFTGNTDAAAVLEWLIAFIFSFYVFSFVIDLYPAVRTRNTGAFRTPAQRYAASRDHARSGSAAAGMEEEGLGSDRLLNNYRNGSTPVTNRPGSVPSNF